MRSSATEVAAGEAVAGQEAAGSSALVAEPGHGPGTAASQVPQQDKQLKHMFHQSGIHSNGTYRNCLWNIRQAQCQCRPSPLLMGPFEKVSPAKAGKALLALVTQYLWVKTLLEEQESMLQKCFEERGVREASS